MTTIPQRQLRNDSAAVLRRVAAGETFTITNNGVPVATLAPFVAYPTRLDQLVAEGVVTPPRDSGKRRLPDQSGNRPTGADEVLADLRGDR
jgi:prevent-host-death family protein